MDAIEAIMTRHMVAFVTDEKPDREEVEELLRAAVRAPNHYLTEPWRFIVLSGGGLDALGEAMAERVRRESRDDPDLERRLELERRRPHRAPTIITVVYSPSPHPKAVEVEDRYAVGALMQNILLAAHAKGLGAYLRTGPAAFDEGVKRSLGLREDEEIAGFIYLGYPAPQEKWTMSRRTPAEEKTEWRG